MVTDKNIKWYMTDAVATALRSSKLALEAERDQFGGVGYEVADSMAWRSIYKACELAHKGGRIAEQLGTPWPVVCDRLGLHVLPRMLVAAVVGMPYEWQDTPVARRAEEAVAEIEQAFGPVRRRVVAEA